MKATLLSCLLLVSLGSALPAETLIIWKKQVLETKFYAEGATFGDINGDGKNDIVYGPFWFEGPDFTKRHTFYEPKEYDIVGYSDNFFAYVRDMNGDGFNDILIIGFPGKEARLYLNPGKDVANYPNWPMHIVANAVDDESPEFIDLTGDGKPEIVCAHGGQFGYFEPDWKDVTKPWTWHPASDNVGTQRFTHGLGIGDVNGDGKMDILEAKHWWENTGGSQWKPHPFNLTGSGGAQMFAYDINGDGKPDIVSSLNAHGFGLAWFENLGAPAPLPASDPHAGKSAGAPGWQKHLIVGQEPWENEYGVRFSQPHAVSLADVDGDGIKDIITGNRYFAHNGHGPNELDPRVLYWFQTKRLKRGGETKVEFIPHMIDGDTGVGTQLVTGDIDGDGLLDVVVGNKYGCRVLLQRREKVSAERYAQFEPKKIYGPDRVQPKDYKSGQSAQDAVKGMILPAGFKAELIAAEPDIVQPIAMCWDERGRLWVAEGNSYPQKRAGDKGPDRILIFEDTKGTGKFDKRTVFIDGLNLVSGIEVGFGGVWVGAAPQFLFIPKDANDKPGTPQVLLDGWGLQDTHETLNSFIWGPDGWLYGCHGVFTYSLVGKPGTPDDQRTPMNCGVWRYHPVRHEFEAFAHGTSNPWGLDYDEHGEFFISNCVLPHMFHIIPGARYMRQGGQHFNPYTYDDIKGINDHAHFAGNITDNAHWGVRHTKVEVPVADDTDQAGGGHAHCGLCIYQGDNFPPEYRGEFIFGNLHGHRLVHDHVDPNGSSFTAQHRADFMRSDDHWFIPIQQKVGPDGALYVSDWSDKQVCHQGSNAIDMWDRSNGRIYRISYERSVDTLVRDEKSLGGAAAKQERADKSVHAPFDLAKLSDLELAKMAVESDNVWFERMARRVFVERDKSGKLGPDSDIPHMLNRLVSNDAAPSLIRMRAMRLVASMELAPDTSLLEDKAEYIRAWTIRRMGQDWGLTSLKNQDGLPTLSADGDAILETNLYGSLPASKVARFFKDNCVRAAKDQSAIVRRETASLLQRVPVAWRADIAAVLLTHKEDENDPNIPLLVWYGIEPVVGADPKAGLMLANASKWDKITGFIYRRMSTDDAGRSALLSLAADMPDAAQREKVVSMVTENARQAHKFLLPANWEQMAEKLWNGSPRSVLLNVMELESIAGRREATTTFLSNLQSESEPLAIRQQALNVVLNAHPPEMLADLVTMTLNENVPAPLRRGIIQGLALYPRNEKASGIRMDGALLQILEKNLSAEEKQDAIATLTTWPEGAKTLLTAVTEKKLAPTDLTPFVVRQLQGLKDKEVDVLIQSALGSIVNRPKPDFAQQKAKWQKLLTPAKLKSADANKGHEIFKGTCATCHKLFGEGMNVGPDLTGSNRANLDYLLDNALDPSAVIGKGYELNVFTMKDARLLSGIMKEESSNGYKLAMPGGVELVLNKADVGKREILKISMMPEGQFDALGPEATAQLVAYLQKDAPKATIAKGATAKGGPVPDFKVAGAIEGETMKILNKTGGNPHGQKMGGFRAGKWSGNDHLWWTGAKIGDVLTLALPVAQKGSYRIKAVLTKAKDYGVVGITLDGRAVADGANINLYDPNVVTSGELDWGTRDLEAGEHKLEVKIMATDSRGTGGFLFGLDYVKLEKNK